MDDESEGHFSQSAINQPKTPRGNTPQCRSRTRSPQESPGVTSTANVNLPNDASANIVRSDTANNNKNFDVDEESLSAANQMKQKLQLDLTRLLNSEPECTGILHEVIPVTKQLYTICSHKPGSTSEAQLDELYRALIHWEKFLEKLEVSSSVAPLPFEDFVQKLTDPVTFKDRVSMFHDGFLGSCIGVLPDILPLCLALFFEGLLGDAYMPFPFKDLMVKLSAFNRSLYNTTSSSE